MLHKVTEGFGKLRNMTDIFMRWFRVRMLRHHNSIRTDVPLLVSYMIVSMDELQHYLLMVTINHYGYNNGGLCH